MIAEEHDHTKSWSPQEAAERRAHAFAEHIMKTTREYARKNDCKFVGAGISSKLLELSPQLPARLWAESDIVPISLHEKRDFDDVDEIADSMARKCILFFGPNQQPRLQMGQSNNVEVDVGGRACFASLEQYTKMVSPRTARAAAKYAHSLSSSQTRLAFFSATPKGGGVARMRHALLRFLRLVNVDCTWWVPTSKPEVVRITKSIQNILQGVATAHELSTKANEQLVDDFGVANAERAWVREGGPLAPRSRGGADVIIVDDPQMSVVISIAKQLDPGRTVIYRSHVQIQADLLKDPDSSIAHAREWFWSHVKQADLFVSHPARSSPQPAMPKEKIAFMPATTDWLDGLNKPISEHDTQYYLEEFNALCRHERVATLAYPRRDYIIQIACCEPFKGMEDALAAYAEFKRRSQFCANKHPDQVPQLVLCGHISTSNPDRTSIFNKVSASLEKDYPELKDSVIIMRLGPSDQLLNVLLAHARVSLQLSTSEGFEVKVSEALQKGVPVVARDTGGVPLQIRHNKNGFLVRGLDWQSEIRAVGEYLDILFNDEERYEEMSTYARTHISDEVGTVGNAICWMYLADQLTHGRVVPEGRRVWDMAREQAGEPVLGDEIKLP
ncbi:hypothetical protein LTR85_007868 [Meristemomyces frigidus]|nr:hypothetical protein LTR85_007868 [Meristemomyces frigidus]